MVASGQQRRSASGLRRCAGATFGTPVNPPVAPATDRQSPRSAPLFPAPHDPPCDAYDRLSPTPRPVNGRPSPVRVSVAGSPTAEVPQDRSPPPTGCRRPGGTRPSDATSRPPARARRYHRRVHAKLERSSRGPDTRLRVLLAIKCLGYGGAERLLVDLVTTRDRECFDYEVAYVLTEECALVPAIVAQGAPVHDLGATHNGDLRWMPRFRQLLRERNFDVVHFHLPYAAAMGRAVVATLPRRERPVVVYTEHSLWGKTAPPVRALNRALIGWDQALVAVSEAARDALPASLQPRADVVIHGLDLAKSGDLLARQDDTRAEVRRELGIDPDELFVLAVANLRVEKGYDVLLGAAQIVDRHDRRIRFAAVGRGPLAEELEGQKQSLGLDRRFTFLGQRDDVLRLLTAADVFVLPSYHEGMPVALMEAMSVGAPIVATAVGGVPQVLTDEANALLVPPGRPEELASAIERLEDDPELRQQLGKAALEQSAMFDITNASRRMEQLYRQLVPSAAP